jgi:hypothetical protein
LSFLQGDADAAADDELGDLDEEANLPLEELLARYGLLYNSLMCVSNMLHVYRG